MNRRVRVLFASLGFVALTIPFMAGVVAAHSGSITVTQTCQSWSVSVSLANNVTADRTVYVNTTIPGTTGIAGNHYNTTFGQIWDASGPAVTSGSVTLQIYNGASLEFTTSASLPTPVNCAQPTPSPFQSFQGQTATPRVTPHVTPSPTDPSTPTPAVTRTPAVTQTPVVTQTPTVTQTPFQSFQGETATPGQTLLTPPPTSSDGNGSSGSSMELLALFICFVLGGLGLAAVETQRRGIRH